MFGKDENKKPQVPHEPVACIQETRISHLEALLRTIDSRIQSLENKFDNGISKDIALLRDFMDGLKEQDRIHSQINAQVEAIRKALNVPDSEVVIQEARQKTKSFSWHSLPKWQQITIVFTVIGYLLKDEFKPILLAVKNFVAQIYQLFLG